MAGMFDSDDEKEGEMISSRPTESIVLSILREDLPAHIGGQRGLFATTNIPAGSLIVLEWPTLTWDKSLLSLDDGIWAIVQQIVEHPPSHQLTYNLHPRNISDVPVEEFRSVEEKFREVAPMLMTKLKVSVEREEMLRLYLVLQHNGFQSGLYWHLCMINHSCLPNCIKFEPRAGSRGASEVWATKDISAGEELLISYVSPLETSFPSSQEYLQAQHGFRCQCERCQQANEAYINETKIPVTANNNSDDNTATEKTLTDIVNDMEANFEGIEQMMHVATQTYRRPPDVEVIEESLETLDHISQQVFDLSDLLPVEEKNRLHVRIQSIQCALLSSAIELFDGQKKHADIASDYGFKLAITAAKLYTNQRQLMGSHHPNLATSLTDLTNALEFLFRLSTSSPNDNSMDAVKETKALLGDVSWLSLQGADREDILRRAGFMDTKKQYLLTVKKETNRLKDLYMLAKRVPAAVKVMKGPGVVYWGKSE